MTESPSGVADVSPGAEEELEAFRKMLLIRRMEERLGERVQAGAVPGAVHLYIGQEAVAVGVCSHLADADWIASTHRGHGHFLAKGGSPRGMVAEIYGRAAGVCGGKGGSMHVADFGKGILGANGIVGGGIGLAAGAALAAQHAGQGRVAVVFFGDGGATQGVVAEAMNLATLWRLPLVFVCENNGFSEFSPTATVNAGRIASRADAYGLSGVSVDGNDLHEVWTRSRAAIRRARDGGGPSLIEARTYRLRGHVETERTFLGATYRTDAEIEEWAKRDPIGRLEARIAARGEAWRVALEQARREVEGAVDDAYAGVEDLPPPAPDTAFQHMLA